MKLVRLRNRTIESTIRTGIVLIVTSAVLFLATLTGKLAMDAERETLEEMSSLSLEAARTHLQDQVRKTIRDFEQMAAAPVLTTSLSDSSGREGYLAPFLAQRTAATGVVFALFDYRGRLLIRTGENDVPIGRPRLPDGESASRILGLRVAHGRIEMEAPIHFEGDDRPIGYLIGSMAEETLLADAGMTTSKFFTANVRFAMVEKFHPDRTRVRLYSSDDEILIAQIGDLQPLHWLNDTLTKLAVTGAIAIGAVLGASIMLARLTAYLISQPVNELTRAVSQLRQGHVAKQPDDMPREIETLCSALFEAFEERDAALRKLQNIAHFDALTGAMSRAHFDQQSRGMLTKADRQGAAATLLYLDLDRFKEVNDSYGHDAGDKLLSTVCERMRGRLRIRDLIGRRGGDEFVVMLSPVNEASDVGTICWDLARLITAPVEVLPGVSVCVGVSMGAATFPSDGKTYEQLMTSADAAMYEAKKAGRGRVAFASGKVVSLSLTRWPEQETRAS